MSAGKITVTTTAITIQRADPPGGIFEVRPPRGRRDAQAISRAEKAIERSRRTLEEHVKKIDVIIDQLNNDLKVKSSAFDSIIDSIFSIAVDMLTQCEHIAVDVINLTAEAMADIADTDEYIRGEQLTETCKVRWEAFYEMIYAMHIAARHCLKNIDDIVDAVSKYSAILENLTGRQNKTYNIMKSLKALYSRASDCQKNISELDDKANIIQPCMKLSKYVIPQTPNYIETLLEYTRRLVFEKNCLSGICIELENLRITVLQDSGFAAQFVPDGPLL